MVHCDYENVKQVLDELKQQGLFKIGDYRVLGNVTRLEAQVDIWVFLPNNLTIKLVNLVEKLKEVFLLFYPFHFINAIVLL